MPNWAFGSVDISGDIEDVKGFLKLFIWIDDEGKEKKEYFARSFTNDSYEDYIKENLEGKTGHIDITLSIQFAWSCHSCMFEGYPDDNEKCVRLDYACNKFNVAVEIETEETGLGFEEFISCDSKGKLCNECRNMDEVECECGSVQFLPSCESKKTMECYECGECGKWK